MANAVRLGAGTRAGASVLAMLLLAACGGGGGGTSAPPATKGQMTFSWTGETHSTSSRGEPIELGVKGPPGSLQALDAGAGQAKAQAQVPSGGPTAFGIDVETQPGVASTTPGGDVSAGPNPGIASLKAVSAGGVTGFTAVDVYPRIALSCGGEKNSAPGYSFTTAGAVRASSPDAADMWVIGPACPAAFASGTPGVYVTSALSLILRDQPFFQLTIVPAGAGNPANYDISTFTQGSASNAWGLVLRLRDGNALKFLITASSCDPQPSCSGHEYVEGLDLQSGGDSWLY